MMEEYTLFVIYIVVIFRARKIQNIKLCRFVLDVIDMTSENGVQKYDEDGNLLRKNISIFLSFGIESSGVNGNKI